MTNEQFPDYKHVPFGTMQPKTVKMLKPKVRKVKSGDTEYFVVTYRFRVKPAGYRGLFE